MAEEREAWKRLKSALESKGPMVTCVRARVRVRLRVRVRARVRVRVRVYVRVP